MPDIAKTISGLRVCLSAKTENKCCSSCPYFNDCAGDTPYAMLRDALELLEANEPAVPDIQNRETLSGKVIPTYYCGKCGKEIYGTYQCCPYCGKRVKWDG